MNQFEQTFSVYGHDDKRIAVIRLNGRHPESNNGLPRCGELRNFKIVEGRRNLFLKWAGLAAVVIRGEDGREATVRLAAFPTDRDSPGYLRFI